MIEIISRAVIISNSHILCVHRKGAENVFLPGGHIDKGETASQALQRELEEELGVKAEAGEFLGIVEHAYVNKESDVQEINLIFRIEGFPFNSDKPVLSAESHLEFLWITCDETVLKDHNLQPWILQKNLSVYAKSRRFPPYMSTLNRNDN